MERLAQYFDDLEDLYYGLALVMERVRRALHISVLLVASFALQFVGVLLALSQPPLALAAVSLAVVTCLYRGATGKHKAVNSGHSATA